MHSSCDLKVSGINNNPSEVSGTVFLSLNCCTSMTLFEFSGGSLFSMCFSFFRVRSHARVRARARWMVRCLSTREYEFVCVYGACLRLLVHTCGRRCLRACLGTLWCFLVFVYLCVFACTFVRVFVEGRPIRRTFFVFPQVDLAVRRHFFSTDLKRTCGGPTETMDLAKPTH